MLIDAMSTDHFIAKIIDQHKEDAASLWLIRDRAVKLSSLRLADLGRFDERIEAHLDGLSIGETNGWSGSLEDLELQQAGEFFVAGVLALVSQDSRRFDQVIECAYRRAERTADEPYHPAHDAWRGIASSLAWVDRAHAAGAIERLINSPHPRTRWLGVAARGARRADPGPAILAALDDPSPLVRARGYRTAGQLGRADTLAQIEHGLADDDPECRFWSAWAAARMGAGEGALEVLADITWNNQPRADLALDLLLRRLDVSEANAWLRQFAKRPNRQRDLIRATGTIGDPLYVLWLIQRMAELPNARVAAEAFCMITGLDLASCELDRRPPADFQSGPTDDPADENVNLDEDEHLPWPDAERIGHWWTANRGRFNLGTSYFLGVPKDAADWLGVLSEGFNQRHTASLELALRQPSKAMFEVRARGRLQRQLLARAQS